jgi:hypothetical protein
MNTTATVVPRYYLGHADSDDVHLWLGHGSCRSVTGQRWKRMGGMAVDRAVQTAIGRTAETNSFRNSCVMSTNRLYWMKTIAKRRRCKPVSVQEASRRVAEAAAAAMTTTTSDALAMLARDDVRGRRSFISRLSRYHQRYRRGTSPPHPPPFTGGFHQLPISKQSRAHVVYVGKKKIYERHRIVISRWRHVRTP